MRLHNFHIHLGVVPTCLFLASVVVFKQLVLSDSVQHPQPRGDVLHYSLSERGGRINGVMFAITSVHGI